MVVALELGDRVVAAADAGQPRPVDDSVVPDLVAFCDFDAGRVVRRLCLQDAVELVEEDGAAVLCEGVLEVVDVGVEGSLRTAVNEGAVHAGGHIEEHRYTLRIRPLRASSLPYTRSRRSFSPRPDVSRSLSPDPAVRA